MASHSGPKNGSGGNLDRSAMPLVDPPTEKQAKLLREFDRLGAKEIRKRIDKKTYDRDTSECAQSWLSHRDLLHFDESIRALEELMQLARNMARDSNLQAHDAASLAQRSNSFARAANETAAGATREARTSTTIAVLALVVAVAAMAIAVAIAGKMSGVSPSDLVGLFS
jgi:hypothetical protein